MIKHPTGAVVCSLLSPNESSKFDFVGCRFVHGGLGWLTIDGSWSHSLDFEDCGIYRSTGNNNWCNWVYFFFNQFNSFIFKQT